MLLDPRNHPRFDTSTTSARRTYVLATTPRSGSTALARMLWASGAGAPKEYLNPTQLRDWTLRARDWRSVPLLPLRGRSRGLALALHAPLDSLLALQRARRSQGGWFGLKLHAHHARWLFGPAGPEPTLGPVTWIRLTRSDRLAQATSWELAHQTDRWSPSSRRRRAPRWSRAAIAGRLAQIHADGAYWDALLADRDVLHLDSADLFTDPVATLSRARDHLGLPPTSAPPPSTSPMNDPTTSVWIEHWHSIRR